MPDPIQIFVCTDCIMFIANGEVTDPNGNDISEQISAAIYENHGSDHLAPGDEEITFSKSHCEGCGNTDAGTRHEAWILGR